MRCDFSPNKNYPITLTTERSKCDKIRGQDNYNSRIWRPCFLFFCDVDVTKRSVEFCNGEVYVPIQRSEKRVR